MIFALSLLLIIRPETQLHIWFNTKLMKINGLDQHKRRNTIIYLLPFFSQIFSSVKKGVKISKKQKSFKEDNVPINF